MPPPPELQAVYRSPSASAPVQLWAGRLHYRRDTFAARGDGTVTYEWRPTPRLRFHFSTTRPPPSTPPDNGTLVLWGSGATAAARLWQFRMAGTSGAPVRFTYEGLIAGEMQRGQRRGLRRVMFHLLNFPDYLGTVIGGTTGRRAGRVECAFGGWRLTLDNLAETRALRNELQMDGGYAITHVGEVRRADGSAFTARSVSAVQEDLGLALSFARGGWSFPLLLVGMDRSGAPVWQRWDDKLQSPFVYRMSWLDPMERDSIAALIPGFFTRCQDQIWREPMRRGAILYVDANQHPRVEVSIVLTQVALELLSWALLVIDQQAVTRAHFDRRWDAAERIRQLLGALGIPAAVPSTLPSLASLSGPPAPGDGPQRIVYVRNRIVHPPKAAPASWPASAAAIEAEHLGLEYLELALLRLSDYRGRYWSRTAASTQNAPWI